MGKGASPLLAVEEVSVLREGRPLLDRVSLELAHGSVHGLVGKNGAGKSTLLAAILGGLEHRGTIRLSLKKGGRIGYVPQRFHVDPSLPVTVADFLLAFRQRRPVCLGLGSEGRATATRILERVGLADRRDRPLGALSGGELQRVLFASAIDPLPELLILDEAGAGLDEASTAELERTVLEGRKDGRLSALLVAHDREQVRRLCDRVTVLDAKVIDQGPTEDVLARRRW
jgi:zinc transport system ATP-binding protein